jgi:hypothetical protein
VARSKEIQTNDVNLSSKPTECKDILLPTKTQFVEKPIVASTPFSRNQSITSSPTRSTTIANQLSLQRPSGSISSYNIEFDGIPTSSSTTNDLSTVGLMVSTMTLHQRPRSRNSKSSRDNASAMNSKNNSRSGTPTRRRSSGYGQAPPRRNSKQGNEKFWAGNEEFYFPDGTQDDLGREEMDWIAQASSLDDKFYLKSIPPPKVHVVLKKVGTVAS